MASFSSFLFGGEDYEQTRRAESPARGQKINYGQDI
jgi:hypothetical protein